MSFQVSGLPAKEFEPFFAMSDTALAKHGIDVLHADASEPGFPCRIGLNHAAPGTRLLLMNYEHQPADSPYRSAHAIYVAEGAADAAYAPDEVPEPLAVRTLSLRAYDSDDMMIDADIVEGSDAAALIERFFGNPAVAYLHAHYAKRGCFAAHITRVR